MESMVGHLFQNDHLICSFNIFNELFDMFNELFCNELLDIWYIQ